MDKQAFYNHNKKPILGEETEFIKSTFSRDIEPVEAVYAPIHIFGTGSDGNSMYIKHLRLLVDIGLPKTATLSTTNTFLTRSILSLSPTITVTTSSPQRFDTSSVTINTSPFTRLTFSNGIS